MKNKTKKKEDYQIESLLQNKHKMKFQFAPSISRIMENKTIVKIIKYLNFFRITKHTKNAHS